MKNKYLIKLSLIFSFLFLFILTSLFSFLFLISLKPIKINLLDYFDRKSAIYKKLNVKEIGSVYLSFNKISKNFEILAEDILLGETYLKNVQIGVDITLTESLFDTTLKIFNGRFHYKLPELDIRSSNSNNEFEYLNYFKNIEIVNSYLELSISENNKSKYNFDLLVKDNTFNFLVNETNPTSNNYLLIKKEKIDDLYNFKVNNFNFDFLRIFLNRNDLFINYLDISGEGLFDTREKNILSNIKSFNLKIDTDLGYLSNKGKNYIEVKGADLIWKKNNKTLQTNLNFLDNGIYYNFSVALDLFNNKSQMKIEADKFDISYLLKSWPKDFKMSVYDWMNENSSGNISNLKLDTLFFFHKGLSLDSLNGNFDFFNTKIKYMEEMPIVKNLNGKAKINSNSISFNIEGGNSQNLEIIKGKVDLFDLDTDVEKSNVLLQIIGANKNVIQYLDSSIIDKQTYSKLRTVIGNNNINLTLSFPLLVNLKTEQINYKANVGISESIFSEFYNNYDLENFNLNIKIDNDKINFGGYGELLGSSFKFEGNQFEENDNLKNIINGSYILDADSIPLIIFDQEIIDNGQIPFDFKIELLDNDTFKVEGIGNLDEYKIKSNFLGNDLITKGGRVRFLVSPFGDLNSIFFDLSCKNFSAEINANFDKDSFTNIEVSKLESPIQNFKLTFNRKNNEVMLSGNKFTFSDFNLLDNKTSDLNDIVLRTKIKEVVLSDMKFEYPIFNLSIKNGLIQNLNILLASKKIKHKVLIDDEMNKKKFILESNYLPDLAKLLGEDIGMNRGSIKIEGTSSYGSNLYKGLIAGNDIVFTDAPFFANFFSLFSLQGLAQKIKDGGIIFDKYKARYELSKNKLRIIDSLMTGSELGIQFDSVIGLDNDYLLVNGSIIPAYTLNTLLTKFPIVGDIITAGSPEDGLIGANFKIEKDDKGEIDISYNPISVFVPNILKNFLTD